MIDASDYDLFSTFRRQSVTLWFALCVKTKSLCTQVIILYYSYYGNDGECLVLISKRACVYSIIIVIMLFMCVGIGRKFLWKENDEGSFRNKRIEDSGVQG